MNIPFLSFNYMHGLLRQESVDMFARFYDDQYYIMGKGLDKFEEEYAAFSHTKYSAGISNGLDALHIGLKVLGIGTGDEVIVPSNTYIATALAVSYTGATPVFAEPDANTFNIAAENIEKAITPKTKAIIPVHLYGQACEMDGIMLLAQKNNLFVVEDNAQAHGAFYNNKITGSFGHINAASFYPGKNLGALGDGGAVTTDNEEYYEKAKMLRNYGSKEKYYNEIIGYNQRLDELQARFLSIKLKYLLQFTEERQQIASWYNQSLKEVSQITLPFVAKGATHVYHLYVIQCDKRDTLQAYLKQQGIGTLIHYPVPPYLQKAYAHLGHKADDFPVASKLANNCLSLPLYPGLTNTQVLAVAEAIKAFYKQG